MGKNDYVMVLVDCPPKESLNDFCNRFWGIPNKNSSSYADSVYNGKYKGYYILLEDRQRQIVYGADSVFRGYSSIRLSEVYNGILIGELS